MKKFLGIFILFSGLLTGCGQVAENFVADKTPANLPAPPATTVNAGTMAIKITPGKMNSSATDMVIQGTVTATNETFVSLSSDMALSLSINRSRVSPQ